MTTFWLAPPRTPEQAQAALDALYEERHASHDRPAPFCPLCPPRPSRHRDCPR